MISCTRSRGVSRRIASLRSVFVAVSAATGRAINLSSGRGLIQSLNLDAPPIHAGSKSALKLVPSEDRLLAKKRIRATINTNNRQGPLYAPASFDNSLHPVFNSLDKQCWIRPAYTNHCCARFSHSQSTGLVGIRGSTHRAIRSRRPLFMCCGNYACRV